MLEQTGLQHQDITNLLALRNQVSDPTAMSHTCMCGAGVSLRKEARAYDVLWYHLPPV